MPRSFEPESAFADAPLTITEKLRLRSLLDTVGTSTLLNSLLDLDRGSTDAQLIIETLLDRLKPFGGDGAAAGSIFASDRDA